MVFLRPVVMRDLDTATRLSLDRYDLIRARQREAQPVPSAILNNNESPILPPAYVPPASAPQSLPPPPLSPAASAPPAQSTPVN